MIICQPQNAQLQNGKMRKNGKKKKVDNDLLFCFVFLSARAVRVVCCLSPSLARGCAIIVLTGLMYVYKFYLLVCLWRVLSDYKAI